MKEPWHNVEGKTLQQFIIEEFWHDDTLAESASTSWLQIDDQWYRLYFDHDIIFWKASTTPPKEYSFDKSSFRLQQTVVDANLNGSTILSMAAETIPKGAQVCIQLENEKKIVLICENDVTCIRVHS